MAGLTGLGMVGVLVSLTLRLEEAPAANGPAVSGCIATGRAGMVSRGLGWLASRYGEEQSVWAGCSEWNQARAPRWLSIEKRRACGEVVAELDGRWL